MAGNIFHLLSTDLVNPVEFSTQRERSKGKIFPLQSMMYALCGQVLLLICVTEVPCAHRPDQGLLGKVLKRYVLED